MFCSDIFYSVQDTERKCLNNIVYKMTFMLSNPTGIILHSVVYIQFYGLVILKEVSLSFGICGLAALLICALLFCGAVVGFVRKCGLCCNVALTLKKLLCLDNIHEGELSHRVWSEVEFRPVLLGSVQNLSPLRVRTALAVSAWKRSSSLHGFLSFFGQLQGNKTSVTFGDTCCINLIASRQVPE